MKKLIWALVLIGLVGAGSAAAWRQWKLSQTSALPTGIVSGNGRIESIQVDVAAKYGGRIKEILAREGDLVEEGQVLVKMDTNELEAELEKDKSKLAESEQAAAQVKTEITKDESQQTLAEQEFNRSKNLLARKVVSQEEYDRYRTRLETAKASLEGSKAKLKTANQSTSAAAAQVKRTQVQIDDATLKSPVKGRVLYRLAEPAEVVPLGGKVLTLINLGDVYMELYLPAQEAARVKIGADARIVLDARPEYAAQAQVSYVSPEAQFTPKQVETRSERDKLMFRIKLQVPPEIVLPYIERIKTGVRGMGYVRLDDTVAWPEFLERSFPAKP
jgi:HlyD family secretion protein